MAQIHPKLRDSSWPVLAAGAITIAVGVEVATAYWAYAPFEYGWHGRLALLIEGTSPLQALELIGAAVLAVWGTRSVSTRVATWVKVLAAIVGFGLLVSAIIGLVAFATLGNQDSLVGGHRVVFWAHGLNTVVLALVATVIALAIGSPPLGAQAQARRVHWPQVRVEKIGDDRYVATVQSAPDQPTWTSDISDADHIVPLLRQHGVDASEVVTSMEAADPGWTSREAAR